MGYGSTTILLSNKVWFDIPTVGTLTSHFLVAQSYLQLTEGILVSFFNHWLPLAVADPGFSPGGAPTPKVAIIFQIFAKNCMKMKEFGPPGGGRASLAPPLRSANA